jgi:UDP-glucose 4-epimerase
MNSQYLSDLLEALSKNEGALLMQENDKPRAVLLSMEKYQRLTQTKPLIVDKLIISNSPTVLITGGTGYVGSHLANQLVAKGHKVVVIDNLSFGSKHDLPEQVLFYEGDITDELLLESVFNSYKFDAVVHCATSQQHCNPETSAESLGKDILGLERLSSAMNGSGPTQIIMVSSASVYGLPSEIPVSELAMRSPQTLLGYRYDIIERMLEHYVKYFGLRATIFRCPEVCAKSDSVNQINRESSILNEIKQVIEGKRESFVLNSNSYPTFDGTAIRDLLHINDLVQAITLSLETPSLEPMRIYNVSSGVGVSMEQIVSLATELSGRMIPLTVKESKKPKPAVLVLDPTRIVTELGFKAQFSDLETILKFSL